MKEKNLQRLLTVLVALMLCAWALAVPSGHVTDEADTWYRDQQEQEDDWLLQYHRNNNE